jgi:hypothetical protein
MILVFHQRSPLLSMTFPSLAEAMMMMTIWIQEREDETGPLHTILRMKRNKNIKYLFLKIYKKKPTAQKK